MFDEIPAEKTVIPRILICTVITFFSSRGKPSMPKRSVASQPVSQFRNESIDRCQFQVQGKGSAIESAVTRNAVNCRVWTSILIHFFH